MACLLAAWLLALLAPLARAQFGLPGGGGGTLPGVTSVKSPAGESPAARAELIADAAAIVPGRPFRIGVHFQMIPDWHIYWVNSGDSGYPTTVTLQLPPGFKAGALQWPAPERFALPEETVYGYPHETVLFYKVTPPATLTPGEKITFKAQSQWLVCKEQCVPGENKAMELTLPVIAAGAPEPAAPQRGLLERFAAAVPVAGAPPAGLALPAAAAPGQPGRIEFTIPAAQYDAAELQKNGAQYGLFAIFPDDLEATHAKQEQTPQGIKFTLPIQLRPQAARAEYEVTAVLALPRPGGSVERLQFKIPVSNAAVKKQAATAPSPVPPAPQGGGEQAGPSGKTASSALPSPNLNAAAGLPAAQRGALWLNLLYAFIGGLILNFMPCVLPVISIKVLGFVRQAQESPARIRALGLTYVAGIVASFMLLAGVVIAIKAGGAQAGWGFQFQEPRFVILMAAVVFAMALSLFGLFEIEAPRAAGRLAARNSGEGLAGAFWSGALTTALATPCVGPFLAGAIGYFFTQPPAVIALFFLVVSLGLSLPYIALAFRPGWLGWIPKPGAWMDTFKQLMGFVLMATALFLLWVLASLTSAQTLVSALGFLLAVAFACWWLGKALDPRRGRLARRAGVAAALAIAAAGYYALAERPIRLAETALAEAAASGEPVNGAARASGEWEPFTPQRAAELAAQGRTVFVDFTAEWCTTCKFNERFVIGTEATRKLFKTHNVATLKADWTRRDDKLAKILAGFGSSGVPLYVIYPAGRPAGPVTLPTLLTHGILAEALAKADKIG